MNVNIHKFLKKFQEEYDFLYKNHDRVAGYYEALDYGDWFISEYPEFVQEFNRFRGDILSSDREVAAFAFALEDMGVI